MRTQYKLAIGYLLILIVVVSSRFASVSDFADLEENVNQIQTNHMPSVESLGRMGISASSIQRHLYDLTTGQDDAEVEEARRQSLDLMTEVNSRHMIYNTRYISDPEESELILKAMEAWNKFLPVAKSIASDPASASHWYYSSQVKQLMEYWRQIDEKNMALIEYNATESAKATHEAVVLVSSVKDNWNMGAAAVVFLVIFVWGLTSREITKSETALRETVSRLEASNAELVISRDMYQLLVEGSHDALWDWDLKNEKQFISPKWQDIMGFEEVDFLNFPVWSKNIHPDDVAIVQDMLQNHMAGLTPYYVCEYRYKDVNGEYRWILARGKALFEKGHSLPVRMAGSFTDITEKKLQADKIYRNAYYDSLTGLPNNTHFSETLSRRLATKSEQGAVFYIDLDNFKLINDSYGHDWGNLFLKAFADRLQQIMPDVSIFCRMGGDEFTIALFGVDEEEAVSFAKRILNTLGAPFTVNDTSFFITASIGIVLYPSHGTEVAELLRKADVAMYRAKETGKNSVCLFDDFMEELTVERLSLENSLRKAIHNNEFSLHYQPIIRLSDRQVIGFEALLRWNSTDYGPISPMKFIPVAENTGMIIPIGEWVLKETCTVIKQIHDAGFPDIKISVNLSAKQLTLPAIAETVKDILEAAQLDPSFLEIEITESVLIESSGVSLRNLELLAGMGLSIALDDFGTGYSSLTYLQQLPIKALKLDKSFLDRVGKDNNSSTRAIVDGVISIAHTMGLAVIAEGVEEEEQLDYLRHQQCAYAQGYLISRPMPQAEALHWLKVFRIRNGK